MSRIGLIDVDSHNYPNLALMKLSAWHKNNGDDVMWYDDGAHGHMDKVYMSKVFSFSPDYDNFVDSDEIIRGGSGYCIKTVDGIETYDKSIDKTLPEEIEHVYPDYSIYGDVTSNTAYGFLTRGCPRQCPFCHVSSKEGCRSYKVADLDEFWHGQKELELLDPNILACKDWKDLMEQVIDSKCKVNFNQGLDIRFMTEEKAEHINRIRPKAIHFAWDKYEDGDLIKPKFEEFIKIAKPRKHYYQVYVLCNYDTNIEQDLERIYWLRDMGYAPYVMLYNKESIPRGHEYKKLQRWVNNRFVFWKVDRFEDYKR